MGYTGNLQVLTNFLLKEFYIICGLGILYKTLLARKLSKPEDCRYRPKHVVFLLLINTIIQPYIYSCVLTEFTSP